MPSKIQRTLTSLSLCGALAAAGYSVSKAATRTSAACSAQFRGNVSDLVTFEEDCGTLVVAADAGPEGSYLLSFHGHSKQIANAVITVNLGATPTPGMFSAQGVAHWSASVTRKEKPGCELRASSGSVPTGSFALSLSSISLTSGDASSGGSAHGSLNATLYVHAPPHTDCGAGEIETVAIAF